MIKNIGKNVQRERKKKGLTQEQLAEAAGISWSAVSRFETGQSMPSLERIIKIAEVLDVGIETLLYDYVKVYPNVEDDESREIIQLLSISTMKEKRHLLEYMKMFLAYHQD